MSLYHTSMQTIFAGDLIIPNFFQINNINFSANYKPDPTGYEDEIQKYICQCRIKLEKINCI